MSNTIETVAEYRTVENVWKLEIAQLIIALWNEAPYRGDLVVDNGAPLGLAEARGYVDYYAGAAGMRGHYAIGDLKGKQLEVTIAADGSAVVCHGYDYYYGAGAGRRAIERRAAEVTNAVYPPAGSQRSYSLVDGTTLIASYADDSVLVRLYVLPGAPITLLASAILSRPAAADLLAEVKRDQLCSEETAAAIDSAAAA